MSLLLTFGHINVQQEQVTLTRLLSAFGHVVTREVTVTCDVGEPALDVTDDA